MKKHRISSGAIVVQDQKILLVRHQLKDKYDFWVAPGGGILDEEDILSAAVREPAKKPDLLLSRLNRSIQSNSINRQHII